MICSAQGHSADDLIAESYGSHVTVIRRIRSIGGMNSSIECTAVILNHGKALECRMQEEILFSPLYAVCNKDNLNRC